MSRANQNTIPDTFRRISDLNFARISRSRADAKAAIDERDGLQSQLDAASHNLELLTEQKRGNTGKAAQRLGSDEQALLYELRGHRRRSAERAT